MVKSRVRLTAKRFWARWRPVLLEMTGALRKQIKVWGRTVAQTVRRLFGV